ncbi:hypothetical protein EON65_34195 [archaeon]|nr:MAG: hypothetical protein EON65_34195 [archaeon]
MAHFIKVNFEVKDVANVRKGAGKKKNHPGLTKQGSQGPQRLFPDMGFEPAPAPAGSPPSSAQKVARSDPIVPEVHDEDRASFLPLKPNPARPKSASQLHRQNPHNRLPQVHEPWKFTAKGLDFDALLVEQDLYISRLRLQHPELYEEARVTDPSSAKLTRPSSAPQKNLHNFAKMRFHPHSIANAKNHPFPQYPFLHEDNHGIHKQRWSVMTAMEDDPERCKPTLNQPRKSREDLWRAFYGNERSAQHELEGVRVSQFKDIPDV